MSMFMPILVGKDMQVDTIWLTEMRLHFSITRPVERHYNQRLRLFPDGTKEIIPNSFHTF